jgi:FkbM family methyltransferase
VINFSAVRPNTLAGRFVRYPFRVLPRDLAMPVLQGPLRGKKWIVGAHLHGCWLGSYEMAMQNRMVKELSNGAVFYDVGANVGFYTLLAAVLIGRGHVYAFEPVKANLVYLRRHLSLNHLENVSILECAVSDATGTASFAVEETRAMGHLDAGGGVEVQMVTLDALLREGRIAPPDCIKMDIEGAEFRALLGARQCFAEHKPKLFLATHGRDVLAKCCELLDAYGYGIQFTSREADDRAELLAKPR